MCISIGQPSRGGDFAADGIVAQGGDDHVPVMAAAFGRTLSSLDISAPSCLLMRADYSMPHAKQVDWLAAGDPIKTATLAREFCLALVEVPRQRSNEYRLTH
jgi:hypothetical protein